MANPENRWVKKAETIPWITIEDCYAELFPSSTGMPAKPLRLALGSLIIQKQYDYADRELVEQLTENPYYQFFIGLPGYQQVVLCQEHGIRLSDPALGRPKKETSADKDLIYTDAVDRIENEGFSLAKRCYGLGLIRTKLDTTSRSSICLSIIAMNVARLSVVILCELRESIFQGTRPDIWYYLAYENGIQRLMPLEVG